MSFKANIEDVSDGKFYDYNDMVKTDTRGCVDCSACCHHMNETIVLNPFDMNELMIGLGTTYDELIEDKIGLHTEDKVTLPHLMMVGDDEACAFLNNEGWCGIHGHRPDLCRLFPLGRAYVNNEIKFIFKPGECIKTDLSKIRVKKWVNIQNYEENKQFIKVWNAFIKALKFRVKFVYDDAELKEINNYLINTFYNREKNMDNGFYETFYKDLSVAKDKLGVL